MKVTIIPDDSVVIVNGNGRKVEGLTFSPDITAIQWEGVVGEVEYRTSTGGVRKQNKRFTDFSEFSFVLAAWEAAAPKPDEPVELPPPNTRIISPLAFLERLLLVERKAIRRAAKQNEDLEDWLDLLRVAGSVDLDDPRTVGGVDAMVAGGLLTAARRDEILS